MKKKLILFDIDGILLHFVSVGATNFLIKKYFGLEPLKSKLSAQGKTYRKILAERLNELGLKNPEEHKNFEIALKDSSLISDYLKKGFKFEKIPHVERLVKKLDFQGNVLGLLTGNTYRSAKVKLESVGLWKYFSFGAFGSESLVRGELVSLAMKEAEKETGIKFDKKDVFVIGDTPLDVECAKYGRVRSIAVATGSVSLKELEKEKPDFAFRDFSDIDKILEAINS